MKKGKLFFILLTIVGTLFLLPNFYMNKWEAVEPTHYDEWQTQYDRLVVARLVKTRQDGFLSAGGLLGLGDTAELNYLSATHRHQYEVFLSEGNFNIYTVYKSNPGFQGVLYGVMDHLLDIPGKQKLTVFRGITSSASALVFGCMFAYITMEFGILAGAAMLLYSAFTIWVVLPAGSIFSNLWAFYLPFIVCSHLLIKAARENHYNAFKIHATLFIVVLLKILLSGFDIVTTVLVMTTVPILFYSISDHWNWKTFTERFIKISITISIATVAGLTIMSFQINSTEDGATNAFSYIQNRFGHHFAGNSNYYLSGGIEPTKIGIFEIVSKYANMPTVNIPWPGDDLQILHWHLITVFALFTSLYFVFAKGRIHNDRKAIALIAATWYSILAPLSWIIIFRPHSIINTHYNTMAWQMPFTLLGFALCGYVISFLLSRKIS